jgi:hypothetical protein
MLACSNTVSLVPIQPILISILFHHYKELMELKAQVEQREHRVREEGADSAAPTNSGTLESYFMIYNRF